jgi:hypothetical protein
MPTKLLTADALANVHGIDLTIEKHAVNIVLAVAFGPSGYGAVGHDVDDLGPGLAEFLGQPVARDVRTRKQDALALETARRFQRIEQRRRRGIRPA